ncbi:hypothetical protein [Novosphingobium rosa]|uniref:hypothetical protein n=1 Tax=Novosphingobium rosa TaxID=76978 RepID=UPI000A62CA31|nr:hypothetical protein [Novosphingobium rosa]
MATIDLSDAHTRRTSLHGRKGIAAGVHDLLTQPRCTVVQQLTIVPRGLEAE